MKTVGIIEGGLLGTDDVGATEGMLVGILVGAGLGMLVGVIVGVAEGIPVGTCGMRVGIDVGIAVGAEVGAIGLSDEGCIVGRRVPVGCGVGENRGNNVGFAVTV